MKHTTGTLIGLVAVVLALSACGGEEKQGVSLEVAANAAPTDTPVPTPAGIAAPDGGALTGRLLYLKGQQFELLDLATGETIHFTDLRETRGEAPIVSYSPVTFDRTETHGAFVAFPDFGTLDLASGEIDALPNTGSLPNGLLVSPDGQWIAATTGGGFVNRLALLAFDGSASFTIASSSQAFYQMAWTPDSRLVWAAIPLNAEERGDLQVMVFDAATGDSAPVGDAVYEVQWATEELISPDRSRLANIPIGFGVQAAQDNPDACFDSYVEIIDLPLTTADPFREGTTVYASPGWIASSPQWLDDDTLLLVQLGQGQCGEVEGEPERAIMRLDLDAEQPDPVLIAGPLGNADDPNDRAQQFGRSFVHLYSPSPDRQYIAWVAGGRGADETLINVTRLDTGDTQAVLRFGAGDFIDAADFIENGLIRQVVWLE